MTPANWKSRESRKPDGPEILQRWMDASSRENYIVLGDLNLDFGKWNHPEVHHEKMVEETQNTVESSGFRQFINKHTRSCSSLILL